MGIGEMGINDLAYKRSKFSTRLPSDRRYTASHAWLREDEVGVWRVGFTKFATRMLGEPVEFEFEVSKGSEVEAGQIIGWIEGFKAVTDVFCPLSGQFAEGNSALGEEIDLLQRDPYGAGWLYRIKGTPPHGCVDVSGYAALLDGTIDKMMGTGT